MMLCFRFRQHFRQRYLKAIKKVAKMLFSYKTAEVLVNQLFFEYQQYSNSVVT